jgi:hypothetical protein
MEILIIPTSIQELHLTVTDFKDSMYSEMILSCVCVCLCVCVCVLLGIKARALPARQTLYAELHHPAWVQSFLMPCEEPWTSFQKQGKFLKSLKGTRFLF